MSSYQRVGWTNTPQHVYWAAKERAAACLDDPSLKLTTLERAFYEVIKRSNR